MAGKNASNSFRSRLSVADQEQLRISDAAIDNDELEDDSKFMKYLGSLNKQNSLLDSYIMLLVRERSSAYKPLAYSEIVRILTSYPYEFESLDRRSVSRTAHTLEFYGFDIVCTDRGCYYSKHGSIAA